MNQTTTTPAQTEPSVPVSEIRQLLKNLRNKGRQGNLSINDTIDASIKSLIDKYDPQPVPFSIESYNRLVVAEKTHEVKTRNGGSVRILATDIRRKNTPVAADVFDSADGSFRLYSYTADGSFEESKSQNPVDLLLYPVAAQPEVIGYINLYADDIFKRDYFTSFHQTKEQADKNYAEVGLKIACIPVNPSDLYPTIKTNFLATNSPSVEPMVNQT